MTLLRIWLWASAALLAFLALYAYAPIVLVFLVVTAGFGLLSAVIVTIARRFDCNAGRPPDG